MDFDRQEVKRAIGELFKDGDVFEVRALDARNCGEYGKPRTMSGYFDTIHDDALCDALERMEVASGVYVTLNPVNPALLARCAFRMGTPKQSTQDADIVRRQWLPLDFDPERPAGISSSDAEHEKAMAFAIEMAEKLKGEFGPALRIDSGNGAHLLYPINLPNDAHSTEVVKAVLETVSRYAVCDGVKVDAVNFNPARIWKLPGTFARKGDNLPDRPHRMARIVDVPEEMEGNVSPEVLESYLQYTEAVKADAPTQIHGMATEAKGFDGAQWVAEHFPEARELPYAGGTKWILKVCPFNPEHNRGEAVIIRGADGRMGFRCHHNSCSGNDWHALRELLEPGCYDVKPEEPVNVDASAILEHSEAKKQEEPEARQERKASSSMDVPPFPEELFNVPGFIGMCQRECLRLMPSPNRMTAFVGAVALQAFLAGRKVKSPTGTRCNVYMVALAKSGCGKDFPRQVNARLGDEFSCSDPRQKSQVLDAVASPQGMEDSMLVKPNVLWQYDEFYALVKQIAQDREGVKTEFAKMLLSFYSSASTLLKSRAKVGRESARIPYPHLVLHASSTPELFFGSLNEEILAHGLFSRMSVFVSEEKREFNPTPGTPDDLNPQLFDICRAWGAWSPEGSGNLDVEAKTVPFGMGVADAYVELGKYAAEMQDKVMPGKKDAWIQSIWSRCAENALKFALVHACSKVYDGTDACPNIARATISMDSFDWGRKLALYEAESKIAYVQKYYFASDFEGKVAEILSNIDKWCRQKMAPMPYWKLRRIGGNLEPRVFKDILTTLEEQNRLKFAEIVQDKKGGKPKRLAYPSDMQLDTETLELIP